MTTSTLPAITQLSARTIEAEMVALCDAAALELDTPVGRWVTSEGVGAVVTAAELAETAAAARSALTKLAVDVPDLAVTVGFTGNASFERAFDAGLVSWADDGALVWA